MTPTQPVIIRNRATVAKLYTYWKAVNYRQAYGMFACNGILFNHDFPTHSFKSELSSENSAIIWICIHSRSELKLKAIVLTHDENHLLTDHMIQSYQEVWPSNPFKFRVPYQKHPGELNRKYGDKIDLIQTPPDIKQTVLTLIQDLSDEEWVYWSLDDKYLIEINETSANNCIEWVRKTLQMRAK